MDQFFEEAIGGWKEGMIRGPWVCAPKKIPKQIRFPSAPTFAFAPVGGVGGHPAVCKGWRGTGVEVLAVNSPGAPSGATSKSPPQNRSSLVP